MTTLTREVKNFRAAKQLTRAGFSKERDYITVNQEALKGIITYLEYLYTEGEISEKAYKTLVAQILSTFVENSIHFKVERMFDRVYNALEEAKDVILSDTLI